MSRFLSSDECINKTEYIHIIEYFSVIPNNEIMSFAGKYTELKIKMLSEISQIKKETCFLSYVELSLKK